MIPDDLRETEFDVKKSIAHLGLQKYEGEIFRKRDEELALIESGRFEASKPSFDLVARYAKYGLPICVRDTLNRFEYSHGVKSAINEFLALHDSRILV